MTIHSQALIVHMCACAWVCVWKGTFSWSSSSSSSWSYDSLYLCLNCTLSAAAVALYYGYCFCCGYSTTTSKGHNKYYMGFVCHFTMYSYICIYSQRSLNCWYFFFLSVQHFRWKRMKSVFSLYYRTLYCLCRCENETVFVMLNRFGLVSFVKKFCGHNWKKWWKPDCVWWDNCRTWIDPINDANGFQLSAIIFKLTI